jgi:sortase (surface protein transpeptidase)
MAIPGFPVAMRLDRAQFALDGDPEAEAGFVPTTAEPEPVTVAIPFTLEAPVLDDGWEPVIDLYDQSGPGATTAYWQPHDSGPAWYEHTGGPWGFPLSLPTQDLPAGSYQVCAHAWRTADGPARPPEGDPASAANLSALPIPDSAVRLCIPVELVDLAAPSTEAQLAAAPQLEIERFGERWPLLDAGTNRLTEGPGVVPGTPRPGEAGISVVVGHRTTWTAPFLLLDELVPGDRILVVDADGTGTLRFEVTATRIVPGTGPALRPRFGIPDDELAPTDDPTPRLRLVTMHPKYSAMERLIVDAVLVEASSGG